MTLDTIESIAARQQSKSMISVSAYNALAKAIRACWPKTGFKKIILTFLKKKKPPLKPTPCSPTSVESPLSS